MQNQSSQRQQTSPPTNRIKQPPPSPLPPSRRTPEAKDQNTDVETNDSNAMTILGVREPDNSGSMTALGVLEAHSSSSSSSPVTTPAVWKANEGGSAPADKMCLVKYSQDKTDEQNPKVEDQP